MLRIAIEIAIDIIRFQVVFKIRKTIIDKCYKPIVVKRCKKFYFPRPVIEPGAFVTYRPGFSLDSKTIILRSPADSYKI